MAEPTLGKLKNRDTGEELKFSINPSEFRVTRPLDYSVEPCLGQPAPIVAFRHGGASELNFELIFDKDADKNVDVKKVDTFLHGLNKVSSETKSVPLVEFSLGAFLFRGYVNHYQYHAVRFDAKGDATSVRIHFALLSNGDYENAKN